MSNHKQAHEQWLDQNAQDFPSCYLCNERVHDPSEPGCMDGWQSATHPDGDDRHFCGDCVDDDGMAMELEEWADAERKEASDDLAYETMRERRMGVL